MSVPLPHRLAAENCREGRHTADYFKTTCVVCGARRNKNYEGIDEAGYLVREVYGKWKGSRYAKEGGSYG